MWTFFECFLMLNGLCQTLMMIISRNGKQDVKPNPKLRNGNSDEPIHENQLENIYFQQKADVRVELDDKELKINRDENSSLRKLDVARFDEYVDMNDEFEFIPLELLYTEEMRMDNRDENKI